MAAQAKGTEPARGRRGPATPQASATARSTAAADAAAAPKAAAQPKRERPAALRVAAAALALEAAGLCVAGVFAAISTAEGKSSQAAGGVVLTIVAFGTAALLAVIAGALAHAEPWSRIPAAMTQLFVVIAAIALLDGHRPEWGVPALVLAGTCVAGLLTPASLRALNRPSVKSW